MRTKRARLRVQTSTSAGIWSQVAAAVGQSLRAIETERWRETAMGIVACRLVLQGEAGRATCRVSCMNCQWLIDRLCTNDKGNHGEPRREGFMRVAALFHSHWPALYKIASAARISWVKGTNNDGLHGTRIEDCMTGVHPNQTPPTILLGTFFAQIHCPPAHFWTR
jgi:hypothetical protein